MSAVRTRNSVNVSRESTLDLFVTDCPSCGVVYALTAEYEQRRREDGNGWKCPNGHDISFGKSEATRERERADDAVKRAQSARTAQFAAQDQANAAERSARAYRGHLTRLRKRISNGVCPVGDCHRNFANVLAHISKQHPQWADAHPEVMA
jgi:hypothetical protein